MSARRPMSSEPPLVILLNGASSSGKTTIAQLLQLLLPAPLLHAGIDHFFGMLPPDFIAFDPARQASARAGMAWLRTAASDDHAREVLAGAQAERWRADMRRTIAAMAELGNHLVVDEIIVRREWADDYRRRLAGTRQLWVGVRCPIEVLEAREAGRRGRVVGQAREHHLAVHACCEYDLEVDSAALSPYECARAILGPATALLQAAPSTEKKNGP